MFFLSSVGELLPLMSPKTHVLADVSGTQCGFLLLSPLKVGCLACSQMLFCISWLKQHIWDNLAFTSAWIMFLLCLLSTKHFCHCNFSLFLAILYKLLRWLCGKIPVNKQFLNYSDQTVWHQQTIPHSKSLKFPFFLILVGWSGLNYCIFSLSFLHS